MRRSWILGANAVLLVLCSFLAGRNLATLAAALLPGAEDVAPPVGRAEAPVPASWNDRQVVLARNLFNASTLAPTGAAAPDEQESYEKSRLPLRLLGTAASRDEARSWAAVEDTEKRSHQVVKVGDRLKDRADVVRIERRRLVLRNGGKLEELALAEDDAVAGVQPRAIRTAVARSPRQNPAPPAGSARVQRLDENRFAVDRESVDNLSRNPTALFSQARIVPKYDQGAMVGVQLNAIQPGSLFEQIGIQDGDTITEFNGIQVTGQQASAQVLQELIQAQRFQVKVTGRNGQTRELEYELR